MKKAMLKYLPVSFIALLIIIGSGASLSVVWGAQKFSFTTLNMILPLLGAVCGLGQSLLLTGLLFAGKLAFKGTLLTYGIPSLCATASMATQTKHNHYKILNFALHVLLPLTCMILFTLHPVGQKAFVYSWYWLIPVGIWGIRSYGSKHVSFFFTALSSTFVAHAVGSIIWLYSVPMTATQWIRLLPIVAIERLVFASGSTLVYFVIPYTFCRRKIVVNYLGFLNFSKR